MIVLAALVALAVPVHAPSKAKLAGFYQIQTMEVGGGLELRKDGRFRYALAYGALDEDAEGTWTFDGQSVRLTSVPMPKEPAFELVTDSPAAPCALSISVDWSEVDWATAPDVLATYDGAPKELHFLQADDDGTFHPEKCVTMIMPIVPMFDLPGEPLQLSPATGHKLSLRFHPNDLGHVAFRGEPLKVDGSGLLMERYDREIRFVRVRP
jgi:hypothetical protein